MWMAGNKSIGADYSVYRNSDIMYTWSNVIKQRWGEVLVTQSCLTLCKPMDCSPPGSSIYGILQARILEWVAIPFSRGSSWTRDQTWVSCTAGRFFTIWATRQAWNMYISSKPDNSFLALKLSVDSLYSKQIHTHRDIFYKIIEEKPISHVGLAI